MFPKLLIKTFLLLVISTLALSCKTTIAHYPGSNQNKSLPSGQAKKVYGHQSAKAFAPGQQKKRSAGNVVIINANAPVKGKKNK
ncbi:hypothetical protein HUW51_04240 [Adhaeribacter swui]|uniref:Quinol oxidase subunit 4 n=1 Tax=Adhaeribacter swui TaxID=2086471 RepID=A0A7G7G488_9BACT|nr:hypothetical protein [Adhaeribacter swui]QNF31972.1 hypothetical protein HUW51_04240 [Adhaeribacter swui]